VTPASGAHGAGIESRPRWRPSLFVACAPRLTVGSPSFTRTHRDSRIPRPLLPPPSSPQQNFYILWFLLGFRLTGPFVVMLGTMFTKDLARFLSIAVVLLVGFSQAFFVQLGQHGPGQFLRSLMQGFSSMVGGDAPHMDVQPDEHPPASDGTAAAPAVDDDDDTFGLRRSALYVLSLACECPPWQGGAGVTSACVCGPAPAPALRRPVGERRGQPSPPAQLRTPSFAPPHPHPPPRPLTDILLANVVLLNLLIAMMGDTYSNIKDRAEGQWYLERARIILQIEASMSEDARLSDPCKYYGIDAAGRPFMETEVEDDEAFRAKHNDEDVARATEAARDAARALAADADGLKAAAAAAAEAAAAAGAGTGAAANDAAAGAGPRGRGRGRSGGADDDAAAGLRRRRGSAAGGASYPDAPSPPSGRKASRSRK
jgi:hypothetical protein